MKRRLTLTKIRAALPLILALAMGWLWWLSYWESDYAGFRREKLIGGNQYLEETAGLVTGRGGIAMSFSRSVWANAPLKFPDGAPEGIGFVYRVQAPGDYVGRVVAIKNIWNRLGFIMEHQRRVYGPNDQSVFAVLRGSSYSRIMIAVPFWVLLLPLAILLAPRGWQLLRARKRRNENLCPQCGYDLRATPERCPECGTAAVAPKPTSSHP